jgi:hypothetical protein
MNDRELLELAAKAAGHDFVVWPMWHDADGAYFNDRATGQLWNPLTDDGDATRLAIRLGLAVSVEYTVGSTAVLWGPPTGHVREPHGDDPYAATRRAIVRAAAAIGRAM